MRGELSPIITINQATRARFERSFGDESALFAMPQCETERARGSIDAARLTEQHFDDLLALGLIAAPARDRPYIDWVISVGVIASARLIASRDATQMLASVS